eukprot:39421-Chlamydomonas_euryale.AAC.2
MRPVKLHVSMNTFMRPWAIPCRHGHLHATTGTPMPAWALPCSHGHPYAAMSNPMQPRAPLCGHEQSCLAMSNPCAMSPLCSLGHLLSAMGTSMRTWAYMQTNTFARWQTALPLDRMRLCHRLTTAACATA